MKWDVVENNWTEFRSNIRQHWEKITDNQLDMIAGKRDHLTGKIQVMYGVDREEAENQLSDWLDNQIDIDGQIGESKPTTYR